MKVRLRSLKLPAAVLLAMFIAPMAARADCVHSSGSWSSFSIDVMSADDQQPEPTPTITDEPPKPPPCFRCGSHRDSSPSPPMPTIERIDLIVATICDGNFLTSSALPEDSSLLYAPIFDRSLEHPPRGG